MLSKWYVLVATASLFLCACGSPVSFNGTPQQAAETNPGVITSPIDVADDVPACEVNIPQLNLGGNVNAFEFAGSVGVTFGYNSNGQDNGVGVSANVQVSWADMDLSLTGTDPMTAVVIASTDVSSAQTKTNIGANVDFSQFSVGPSVYLETPLAQVTQTGLSDGVTAIKKQTDSLAWVGRVLKHIDDNTVLINAGQISGIQVGDIFTVNNVTHFWSGSPCSSTYYGSSLDSEPAYDVIQITQIPPNQTVAIGTIIQHGTVHSKMGAEVLVKTLAAAASGAPARYLKKNVVLQQITAAQFTIPGGGSFDFQSAINTQIVNVLSQSGAYVFTAP